MKSFLVAVMLSCLSSTFSLALQATWSEATLNFTHRLEDRNPWWGCRNSEATVEDVMELLGARDVEIHCYDNAGRFPAQVWIEVNFEHLRSITSKNK